MSENDAVQLRIEDGVAHVTLNRPKARNTLDLGLARRLGDVLMACETDSSVRAVLLTGAGDSFCAGGDLVSFAAQGDKLSAHLREVTTYFHMAEQRIARMKAPVVAAVQGAAAGGGFSLACACDIVIAAQSASFLSAYTKIGLVPDGGLSYTLPRLVGMRRALELTLLNRRLTAAEARDWGIVTEVVPDADLQSRALEIAQQLATGPTHAFGTTKRLLHSGVTQPWETQLEIESRAMTQAAATLDGREGINAFLQKRPPKYEGT